MKERLFTALCALGALVLFVAMFLRGDAGLGRKPEIARPTTLERRASGYAAAFAWLARAGVQTRSLRGRWTTLAHEATLPHSGNLLILTLPGSMPIGGAEFAALRRWLGAGNTLLIVAAMSDDPQWAHAVGGLGRGDVGVLTGLDFETVRSRDSRRQPAMSGRLRTPRRSEGIPNRTHPFFAGVSSVVALSDFPPQARDVSIPFDGFVLELAHLRQTGEGMLWTREVGGGRVLVSAFGSLWTNRALGLADNARLLANIIASTTTPAGVVIFDDAHQGVSAKYDPATFYRDPRLYSTVVVFLVLWLIWIVGGTRLREPPRPPRGLPESDLIEASGSLFARVVPAGAAALRLLQLFSIRQRAHGDLHEFLAHNPRVRHDELMQLERWTNDATMHRRVSLRKLYNLLLSLENRLS